MSALSYPPSLRLTPLAGPVQAHVTLPGSKSITNRALLLAALADGESRLLAPLHSEDTHYMTQALRNSGVVIEKTVDGDFQVTGRGGALQAPYQTLLIGNSGTTVRFLTAAACLTPPGTEVLLDGVARMRERPIRDLLGALLTLGVQAESLNGHGCPPVRVRGGGMPGGSCRLRGDVSSQFLSALLHVAPYARQDVQIEIVGDLISKPYVDITQAVMRSFGVIFTNDNYQHLSVRAGQRYLATNTELRPTPPTPPTFSPPPPSPAAPSPSKTSARTPSRGTRALPTCWNGWAAVSRAAPNSPSPGRRRCAPSTQTWRPSPTPRRRWLSSRLRRWPQPHDGACQPARQGDGPGAGDHRRTDQTRRRRGGRPDSWVIHPPADGDLHGAAIDTYEDHRMAMSFAVAGLRVPDVVINDPGCVAKTFPDFWVRWEGAFGHE